MKYLKTFVLLFVLFCLFLLMSCSESDGSLSNTELLAGTSAMGKTWRISKIETSLGTVDPFDCVSDNNVTYYPDGRYEVNEGATKCDPTDPASHEGVWVFRSLETVIRVNIGDSVRSWEIVELKNSAHRISSDFSDGNRTYVLKPI